MQIVPTQITNYDRTDAELQAFWLFCVLVAGKNADGAARVIGRMLSNANIGERTPFDYLKQLGEIGIRNALVANRAGQYAGVTRAIVESLDIDLRTATVDRLESVFGVGPKTARFFLLHSRPGIEVAVLDTHVCKWLRDHSIKVPEHLTRKHYVKIEPLFIALAKSNFPGMSIADIDLLIWCQYSGRFQGEDFPEPRVPGHLSFGGLEANVEPEKFSSRYLG